MWKLIIFFTIFFRNCFAMEDPNCIQSHDMRLSVTLMQCAQYVYDHNTGMLKNNTQSSASIQSNKPFTFNNSAIAWCMLAEHMSRARDPDARDALARAMLEKDEWQGFDKYFYMFRGKRMSCMAAYKNFPSSTRQISIAFSDLPMDNLYTKFFGHGKEKVPQKICGVCFDSRTREQVFDTIDPKTHKELLKLYIYFHSFLQEFILKNITENTQVNLFGYEIGGSIAQIATYVLPRLSSLSTKNLKFACETFGAPRTFAIDEDHIETIRSRYEIFKNHVLHIQISEKKFNGATRAYTIHHNITEEPSSFWDNVHGARYFRERSSACCYKNFCNQDFADTLEIAYNNYNNSFFIKSNNQAQRTIQLIDYFNAIQRSRTSCEDYDSIAQTINFKTKIEHMPLEYQTRNNALKRALTTVNLDNNEETIQLAPNHNQAFADQIKEKIPVENRQTCLNDLNIETLFNIVNNFWLTDKSMIVLCETCATMMETPTTSHDFQSKITNQESNRYQIFLNYLFDTAIEIIPSTQNSEMKELLEKVFNKQVVKDAIKIAWESSQNLDKKLELVFNYVKIARTIKTESTREHDRIYSIYRNNLHNILDLYAIYKDCKLYYMPGHTHSLTELYAKDQSKRLWQFATSLDFKDCAINLICATINNAQSCKWDAIPVQVGMSVCHKILDSYEVSGSCRETLIPILSKINTRIEHTNTLVRSEHSTTFSGQNISSYIYKADIHKPIGVILHSDIFDAGIINNQSLTDTEKELNITSTFLHTKFLYMQKNHRIKPNTMSSIALNTLSAGNAEIFWTKSFLTKIILDNKIISNPYLEKYAFNVMVIQKNAKTVSGSDIVRAISALNNQLNSGEGDFERTADGVDLLINSKDFPHTDWHEILPNITQNINTNKSYNIVVLS